MSMRRAEDGIGIDGPVRAHIYHKGPAQDRRQFPPDIADPHLIARHNSSVMQVLTDDASAAPPFDTVHLPPNLVVATALRQTFEAMLRDSPTFRRQCARLTTAWSVTIRIMLTGSTRSEAVTNFSVDREGRKVAQIQLGHRADREELIAHECEHIIEQLDGVDLPALARHANGGVRSTEDAGRFETERAIAVGRQVAEELRTARRKHM